jgi:hypothetical protein
VSSSAHIDEQVTLQPAQTVVFLRALHDLTLPTGMRSTRRNCRFARRRFTAGDDERASPA